MQKLIEWQQNTARREHLEPYMVLQFQTIKDIVRTQPKTSDELLHIKGIGAVKVRKYGNDILKLVRAEGVSGGGKSIESESSNDIFSEAEEINEAALTSKNPGKKEIKVDEVTGEIIEDSNNDTVSVTEFVTMLDTLMRTHFRSVRVQGEIVGFKRNPNGMHILKSKIRKA